MKNYYLKQAVFSLRDSFKIYDEYEQVVYHAHAKMLSVSRQYEIFKTQENRLLFRMKRRIFSLTPAYELFDPQMHCVARMTKRLALFRNIVDIESEGQSYVLQGNIWAHTFSISRNGEIALNVRKQLLSWGDTYEIQIHDDTQTEKLLAFVIMIDSIYHRE